MLQEYALIFWKPVLEIAILSFLVYGLVLFIKGSRAEQLLKGLLMLAFLYFLIQLLGLKVLDWILTKFFAISIVAVLVIFQPELRRALATLGQRRIFSAMFHQEELLDEIIKAAVHLSSKRYGALIAIERQMGLRAYIESGVPLDAAVSSELLSTIFHPDTLLHDGGVIIQAGRIVAAGCLFPLSENPNISRSLGTRHRAAAGLTEESDAICIVVSEETGAISVAVKGELTRDLDRDSLMKFLYGVLVPPKKKRFDLEKFRMAVRKK